MSDYAADNDGADDGVVYGEDSDFSDFMTEINDHFSTLVRESYKAPKDAMEEWQAFKSAVNWNEWFFGPMLATYITLFLIVILFRNNMNFQLAIFTSIFIVVLSAQWINHWCAENWEAFATQNYFQERGTFIAVFLCAPLLFIATIQLIIFLVLAGRTLVEVKKLEFAAARKQKENATAAPEPGSEGGSSVSSAALSSGSKKRKKSKKDD